MEAQILNNRHLAIATMHSKESVIVPLLQEAFHMSCSVPTLNTDLVGTFSGEILRKRSPFDTARKKCEMAMEVSNCNLAISSEGSFGAHPTIPFVTANEELVLLMDKKHRFEVVGKHLTTETNFSGASLDSVGAALKFAEQVGFPSHGLIIRKHGKESPILEKGITDNQQFSTIVSEVLINEKTVWVETDMRALFNPTRMKAIEKATVNLVNKLKSNCPKCDFPGFAVSDYRKGLPCSFCYQPTQSTLATISCCVACDYSEEKKFPHQKREEDPMYCDVCNP